MSGLVSVDGTYHEATRHISSSSVVEISNRLSPPTCFVLDPNLAETIISTGEACVHFGPFSTSTTTGQQQLQPCSTTTGHRQACHTERIICTGNYNLCKHHLAWIEKVVGCSVVSRHGGSFSPSTKTSSPTLVSAPPLSNTHFSHGLGCQRSNRWLLL
jgi:hypothetical protein